MRIQDQKDVLGIMAIGRIVALTRDRMGQQVQPGMTTAELDAIGASLLKQHGARSAPILAYKFPGATCISINDEAAHGIPGDKCIQPGDLVNIDVSAEKDGYWADTGMSVVVPPTTKEKTALLKHTRKALEIALEQTFDGQPVNEIGRAVEQYAHEYGYEIIEELGGHGLGRHIHEPPSVPNYYKRNARQRLVEGTVLTLEPFLTLGARHVDTMADGWTLRTTDGSLVAQFEHTVIVQRGKPIVVTPFASN